MARQVKDAVVVRRCEEVGFDTVYIDNLPMYANDVKEDIDKIRLEQSQFGLQKEPIIKGLREKYEAIKIVDDECFVEIEGSVRVPVSKEQIRILKALVVEQLNRNQDYSDVIAYFFMELVQQIASRKLTYSFEKNNNWIPMQVAVFEEVQEFIRKKLVCDLAIV